MAKGTHTIYVETPTGKRFEADIPCGTRLDKLATDFLEAQGWSMYDRYGRRSRPVVELVDADNPDETTRLKGDLDICEAGIKNGDTLRVSPESVAGCFPGSTRVTLPDGQKIPIEQLQVGDHVLSYSLRTHSTSVSRIVEIHHGSAPSYLVVNNSLTITPTHLIQVNGNWQQADTLQIGDYLQNEEGLPVEVTSIDFKHVEIEVYNLILDTDANFFPEGYLVDKSSETEGCNLDLHMNANFFAEDCLVLDLFAKVAAAASPLFTDTVDAGGTSPPHANEIIIAKTGPRASLPDSHSKRKWWHQILRTYGRYSCYAIFLTLPSDKEAIRYLTDFSDELDLISASDCLVVALGKTDFGIFGTSFDSRIWSLAIDEQISEGHSVKVAQMFGIDFVDFPCMLLFRDIRRPEHIIVTLKDMSAEEIAAKMRAVFSTVHRAAKANQNPLTFLEREKNRQALLAKGQSVISGLHSAAGKTFQSAVEAWIKAVIK